MMSNRTKSAANAEAGANHLVSRLLSPQEVVAVAGGYYTQHNMSGGGGYTMYKQHYSFGYTQNIGYQQQRYQQTVEEAPE